MEIVEMLGLIGTPFGLALVCLFITEWTIAKLALDGRQKLAASWIIGIVLSGVMLALGKYAGYGTYAVFAFDSWQDWTTFALVALSSGLISNGMFDSKILEGLLKLIRK